MVTASAESEPAIDGQFPGPQLGASNPGRRWPLIASLLVIIVIDLVAVWWIVDDRRIGMPSTVDFGMVAGETPLQRGVVIRNHTSHTITCLGATAACGYGCYLPSHLPASIEAGGSIEVIIEYKPPHPETLVRRGLENGRVTDEMLFYFDDMDVPPQTLQIRCQIAMPDNLADTAAVAPQ